MTRRPGEARRSQRSPERLARAGQPPTEVEEADDEEPPLLPPAPALWAFDEESAYLFDHPVGDHRPERHGLRVERERILELGVGDAFALALPGLGDLEATVSWVNEAPNGDRGVGAVVDAGDDEYAVTITMGDRALFGQVATPEGRYLVEGIGGAGAVFLDTLDQVLIDPHQTDIRVPPEAIQ